MYISISIAIETDRIYVDSAGIDFDECGDEYSACGSIGFAMALSMYGNKYINNSVANIFVKGQNENEIEAWQYQEKYTENVNISFIDILQSENTYRFEHYSPCLSYIKMSKSYTITFDINTIKSMSDWYPDNCENFRNTWLFMREHENTGSDTTQTITFNNLIINDLTISESSQIRVFIKTGFDSDTRLILNNCSFYNINKIHYESNRYSEHYFILASSVQIYNTKFYDITYSDDAESYHDTAFIFVDTQVTSYDQEIVIHNCTVTNYHNYKGFFLYFNGANLLADVRSIGIYNSVFSNTITSPALIKSFNALASWNGIVDIKESKFLNVELGSILVTENGNIVTIDDVQITTSQLIKNTIDNNDYLISLFVFSLGDDIEMIDINLKYVYDLNDNCVHSQADEFLVYEAHYFGCDKLIQFIQNDGVINVTSFTVSNDITYESMKEYTEIYTNCGIGSAICSFNYNDAIYDSLYALIYNTGELILHNFYILGTGIYPDLVKNTGNLFVDNVISKYEYYYRNHSCFTMNNCIFDPNTIGINIYFRNDANGLCGGVLHITNSYIYGVTGAALWISSGDDIYIENTIIEYAASAIAAFPEVKYLSMKSVQFINIGSFYQTMVHIINSVGLSPPLYISAQESVINDCYFSFFHPYGFILSAPSALSLIFSSTFDIDDGVEYYKTTLINNTFELNSDDIVLSIDVFLFLKNYLMDSNADLWVNYIDTVGDDALSFLSKRLFDDPSYAFFRDGLISFDEYTVVNLIENKFYGDTISDEAHIAFIFINNTENINCLSNNIFYGYSLYLASGIVTSCYRNDIIDIVESMECWNGGLGTLDGTYTRDINKRDYYIATQYSVENALPLINVESSSGVFAAERISLVSNHTSKDKYFAINFTHGTLLIFDAIFDENIDIAYSSDCDIYCLDIVNNTETESHSINIAQILSECVQYNETLHNVEELALLDDIYSVFTTFTTHWSPHSIELEYNKYYPGGKLQMNHSIMDILNNTIDLTQYEQKIDIILSSEELDIYTTVTIDKNGECKRCSEGIYIQNINVDNVSEHYTIVTSVNNNELISNNINFEVDSCPSGYGRSKGIIQQCEVCDDGYFSLYPTVNECVSCSDNEFDTDAISCNGKNNLIINYNYWMKLYTDDNNSYSMITSMCPPFTCCQSLNGCNYIDSINSTLCKYGRDPNSRLCSKCLDGYSELIGSYSCDICEKNYIQRIIYPLLIAICMTSFIIFDASKTHDNDDDIKEKIDSSTCSKRSRECFAITKIIIFKPICYYFQSISYILIHNEGLPISVYLLSIIELFNLSFDSTSSSSSGYCFLSNMNARDKTLLNLSISSFSMLFLLIFYISSQCQICKQRQLQYLKAFVTILLLCFGQILSVIFKILSCKYITDDMNVHFYFAYDLCYDFSWWISLSVLCIIMIVFIYFFIVLHKMNQEQRDSPYSYFTSLTKSYKHKYWFFEFFILFRRTVLALLTVTSFTEQQYADLAVMIFIICCLFINEKLSPFIHPYINVIDSVCLSSTMIVIYSKDNQFPDITISILILVPLFLLSLFIILFCCNINVQHISAQDPAKSVAQYESGHEDKAQTEDSDQNNSNSQDVSDKKEEMSVHEHAYGRVTITKSAKEWSVSSQFAQTNDRKDTTVENEGSKAIQPRTVQ